MVRQVLAPGDDGPIAELFVALGPTLAEALGPQLSALGVHPKKDRIDPRAGIVAPQRDRVVGRRVRDHDVRPLRRRQGPRRRPGHPRRDARDRRRLRRERAALADDARARRPRAARHRARHDGDALARRHDHRRDRRRRVQHREGARRPSALRGPRRGRAPHRQGDQPQDEGPHRPHLQGVRRRADRTPGSGPHVRAPRRAAWRRSRRATSPSCSPTSSASRIERLGGVARDDLRAHELLRFVLSRPYFDLRRSLGLEG